MCFFASWISLSRRLEGVRLYSSCRNCKTIVCLFWIIPSTAAHPRSCCRRSGLCSSANKLWFNNPSLHHFSPTCTAPVPAASPAPSGASSSESPPSGCGQCYSPPGKYSEIKGWGIFGGAGQIRKTDMYFFHLHPKHGLWKALWEAIQISNSFLCILSYFWTAINSLKTCISIVSPGTGYF